MIALSSTDPAVRAVALGLVAYICIYQLTDSTQTVAAHALRGFKVTLLPMFLHTLCFWGVGLGGGYWATYHALGAEAAPTVAGFWEASVAATVLATALFGWLLYRVMDRQGDAWPLPLKESNPMTDITIYHNPRCGSSRNKLAMLRDRGIEPRVVEVPRRHRPAATNSSR